MKIIKWLDKNLEVALMIISLLVIVFCYGGSSRCQEMPRYVN